MHDVDLTTTTQLLQRHIPGTTGGYPSWILTDQGSEYKGEFDKFCTTHNIEHRTSIARHSQSHGMVERVIATTALLIAHFLDDNLEQWDRFLPYAQLAHNSTIHPSTSRGLVAGYTPAELYLGRKLRCNEVDPVTFDVSQSLQQYYDDMQEQLKVMQAWAEEAQKLYNSKLEKSARNLRRVRRDIRVGSLVKLHSRPRHLKIAKIAKNWKGPYRVLSIDDNLINLKIKHVASSKVAHVHMDHVKRYYDRDDNVARHSENLQPAHPEDKKYEVEKIVNDRGRHGVDKEYLVHWKGTWPSGQQQTWEPEDNLDCVNLLQQYLRRKGRTVSAVIDDPISDSCKTKPWSATVTLDLLSVPADHLTEFICKSAGVSPDQVAAQLAFVPCETYSCADWSNWTRGFHYRDHTQKHRPPRPDECEKRSMALRHDQLVQHVFHAWLHDTENGLHFNKFMENPYGTLRLREFMNVLPQMLSMKMFTCDMCAFGHVLKKKTNVWTDTHWVPTGNTGDGLCHNRCGQQYRDKVTGRARHHFSIGQDPQRAPKGPGA